jgi:hypothetical protein
MSNWVKYDRSDMLLNHGDSELSYRRRKDEEKKSIAWGQRKLGLILIQFLSLFWDPTKVPNPVLVYAGAAPGVNIKLVSKFFPEVEFHLYDPRPFKIKQSKKIHLYNEYFTNTIAREWAVKSEKDKNVYFVSDIRTADYTKTSDLDQNEAQIWKDMQMQMEWYKIIKPVYGHLKFRLPYTGGNRPSSVKYLNGYVFKQPYAPQTSTETRLVPYVYEEKGDDIDKDKDLDKVWSCQKYQDQMFYHNVIIRERWRYFNPFTYNEEPIDSPELLSDWDSMTETQIWRDYLTKRTNKAELKSVRSLSRLFTKRLTEKSKYKDTLHGLRLDPQAIKIRNMAISRDNLSGNDFDHPPSRPKKRGSRNNYYTKPSSSKLASDIGL